MPRVHRPRPEQTPPDPAVPGSADPIPWQTIYSAVAARRMQWDNLLWQVPVLSLTAHAFLLTITLGPDSAWWARATAGLLSALVSAMSVLLMARHRQGELFDAHWLEDAELVIWGVPDEWQVHGEKFADGRKGQGLDLPKTKRKRRTLASFVPLKAMFALWVYGLGTFGILGLAAAVISVVAHFR